MGEITEALRRARRERESGQKAPGSTRPAQPGATTGATNAPEPSPTFPSATRKPEAHVPDDKRGFWQARATLVEDVGPVAERWRQIALQVRRALEKRSQRSLLVTSSQPEEGKTVTACNLALALATVAAGQRVALVDLDLRSPAVARGLRLEPEHGLEEALAGRVGLAEVCVSTDVADLDVYPVVAPVAQAHRLLSSNRLPELLGELERSYALIICDSPPVLPVPDVPLIAPHVGACLLVTRAGVTRQASFRQMLSHIPEGKVIGTILNDVKASRRGSHYYQGYGPRTSDE